MGDLLLSLSGKTVSRSMLSFVGLPTPTALVRADGPDSETPLEGLDVQVGGGPWVDEIRGLVQSYGARIVEDTEDETEEKERLHGLIFDATHLRRIEDLKDLRTFFGPRIRRIERGGRVVVLGGDPNATDEPEVAAVREALMGFVKSLAKELGRRATTANSIRIDSEPSPALSGPLSFLLSRRSAFVTGQLLHLRGEFQAPANPVGSLRGKTAVVTGASRGIGRATARRLAEEGAKVLCLDLRDQESALVELAAEIDGIPLPMDITQPDASDQIHEAAGTALDVVVHNAGITRDKTLARMPAEFWDLTMDVNLGAVHRVCTELIANDGLTSDGRIVLVSSIAGIAGNLGQTNYAASKAGVIGLTRGLSKQLSRTNRVVNAVAPGFIETRLTAAIPFAIREGGRRLSCLGQGGQPRDIADAILFLSSNASRGIRGSVLRVCGGSFIGA